MSKSDEGSRPRVAVYARIGPDDLAELDRLAAEHKPVPLTRSEMIYAAVLEYIDRHGRQSKRR